MKVTINRVKSEYNKFKVNMELTHGAILAMNNALKEHAIAEDLWSFLRTEMEKNELTGGFLTTTTTTMGKNNLINRL